MSKSIWLSIIVCLILILNSSAQIITPEESDVETYTLNPFCSSWPIFDNYSADLISSTPELQAHIAFDLSSIPDNTKIVSATFSAYFYNDTTEPSDRKLWYNSDDSWIDSINTIDPGDSVAADEIVGNLWHEEQPEQGYVWKTITITYDGWANDIEDGFISFMLTSGQYGAIGLYTGNSIDKEPELVLEAISEPNKVYTNIFNLGPEEIVQADGLDINTGDYSVPCTADWNNDGLMDLILGSKSGNIRVYLNIGTEAEPQFSELNNNAFNAKSYNSDIYCSPSGCMGCFPRVVDWDSDGMKDLIVGQSDGSIKFFRNINTDNEPVFDNGAYLQHIDGGSLTHIDIGSRATPDIVDWNNDGLKDIVSGSLDGYIHIFINEGTETEPVLGEETFAIEDGIVLFVPSKRSSPFILDLDFDGKKDILTGDTNGQLLLYKNIGTDEAPEFSGYELVESNGTAIDLTGTPRSRPFVCYWDEDGYPDVLVGAYDGKIHLYRCKTLQADFDKDGDIDFADWALFTSYWDMPEYEDKKEADLNNDGKVDIDDVSWILANWLLDIK
ncbi:MAG: VCBS repeat-containing protein [Sedimentisphaerales bacterium]|nr:VCBS repeat-containing protein [Sedimentisphaerales bacterium]